MLDEAAKDSEKSLDMQDVKLFGGVNRKCKVGALGYMNCCKDSGWANGILDSCSESELALIDRIQAKAAVYIGTYCSRKVLGVCVSKRRSYCTFNSQLAMVFQKEIHHPHRHELGVGQEAELQRDQARRDRDDRLGQDRSLGSLRRHDERGHRPGLEGRHEIHARPVRCHGRRGGGRPVT